MTSIDEQIRQLDRENYECINKHGSHDPCLHLQEKVAELRKQRDAAASAFLPAQTPTAVWWKTPLVLGGVVAAISVGAFFFFR